MSKYDLIGRRFLKKAKKMISKIFTKRFILNLVMGLGVFALALAIYIIGAKYWTPRQRPVGDEPHYLIITQSLVADFDLDLTNNYVQKDYQAWNYPNVTLDPHTAVRSQNGKQYSFHDPGWPLIMYFPYKWWGVAGARALASLIGALLVLNIFLLVKKITGRAGIAWLTFLSTAFSVPYIIYANQLFSEILAALLITYAVRMLWERLPNIWSKTSAIIAISYLPWIHVKYIWVSILLFLIWTFLNRKNKTIFLGIIYIFSGILLSYLFKQWYGTYLPDGQYPVGSSLIQYRQIEPGVLGLLLDSHYGLLVYAPVYIFSLAGLVAAFMKDRYLGILLSGTFLAIFLQHAGTTALFGWAPVGRFWVAALPMLTVSLGVLYPLMRTWNKVILYLGVIWGTLAGYLLILHPDLNYSTGDPVYLSNLSSKLIDFTRFFPKIIKLDTPPQVTDWHLIYYWLGAILFVTVASLIFRARKA